MDTLYKLYVRFSSSHEHTDCTCFVSLMAAQVTPVSDFNLVAVQLTHDVTGAEHLHIARNDSNNTFRWRKRGGGERGHGITDWFYQSRSHTRLVA